MAVRQTSEKDIERLYNRSVSRPTPNPHDDRPYEAFYGFREQPFATTTDPRFFFLSTAHRRAYAELLDGLRRREGLLMITGETGTGKTTLCRAVVAALGAETFSAFIVSPYMTGADLLRLVLRDFGLVSRADLRRGSLAAADVSQLLDTLEAFLTSLVPIGGRAVLVLDEAQAATPAMLDQLRLLHGLEHEGHRLIDLVLSGQPALIDTVQSQELAALNERVTRRVHLEPLGPADIPGYVQHRLLIAGGAPTVRFDAGALQAIADLSHGLPRRINVLCDRALQEGRNAGATTITAALIGEADQALGGVYHQSPADLPPLPDPAAAPVTDAPEEAPHDDVEAEAGDVVTAAPDERDQADRPEQIENDDDLARAAVAVESVLLDAETAPPESATPEQDAAEPSEPVDAAGLLAPASPETEPAFETEVAGPEASPDEVAAAAVANFEAEGAPPETEDTGPAAEATSPGAADLPSETADTRAEAESVQPEAADVPAASGDADTVIVPAPVRSGYGPATVHPPIRPGGTRPDLAPLPSDRGVRFLPIVKTEAREAETPVPEPEVREPEVAVDEPDVDRAAWIKRAAIAAAALAVLAVAYVAWSWEVRDPSTLVTTQPDRPAFVVAVPDGPHPVPPPDELDARFQIRLRPWRPRVETPSDAGPLTAPLPAPPPPAAVDLPQ